MFLRYLILTGFILSSAIANATPQQLLENIHNMRLASTNAVTNFYMFSGLDADSKYEQRIHDSIQRFDNVLASAQSLAGNNDMQADISKVSSQWDEFKELMEINRTDLLNKGFPQVRLVIEMAEINDALVVHLSNAYQDLQEKSGIQVNSNIEQVRSLALLMEEITSEYSIRATTNMGHVYAGIGDSAIVEMADQFQKQLETLNSQAGNNNTQALLNNIQSKWKFIESRIRNFNENTVVFLVVSYNDRIVEHLQELEEIL